MIATDKLSMFSGDLHALTLGILSLIFEGIWIPQLVLCSMKYDKERFFHFIADVDECSTSVPVCDFNADCKNTRGSYHCTCKAGFTGDGRTCTGKRVAEC